MSASEGRGLTLQPDVHACVYVHVRAYVCVGREEERETDRQKEKACVR